jgi:hypothetical protein
VELVQVGEIDPQRLRRAVLGEMQESFGSMAAHWWTQTSLCRHSSRSLCATGNSAGKEFGEARDWAGISYDTRRFRATETVLSRVSGGKAAESQRLFDYSDGTRKPRSDRCSVRARRP